MKVDLAQIPEQGSLKVNAKAGVFTDSLKDGDRVKADVISNDKGIAVLKTEGGQTFRARLDSDVALFPGDKVTLEVTGRENGVLSLAIRGEDATAADAAGQTVSGADGDAKDFAMLAAKLAELKIPVSEETVRAMRELIAQNPGMTADEAAFLASNKLTGDENLVKAALAVLSDGEKADAMIARLMALLEPQELPEDQGAVLRDLGSLGDMKLAAKESESIGTLLTSDSETVSGQSPPGAAPVAQQPPFTQGPSETPLSSFLSQLAAVAAPDAGRSPAAGAQPADQMTPVEIIPQDNSVLQSISTNNVENSQNIVLKSEQAASEAQNPSGQNATASVNPEITSPDSKSGAVPQASVFRMPDPGAAAAQDSQESRARGIEDAATRLAPDSKAQVPDSPGKVIAGILSDIPEFRGTPAAALERFSNMLLRVASDEAFKQGVDTDKLAGLLDKLFTRIEKNDKDAGERLKSAREELFARLTLVEEAISRAAPPAKAEMLDQTRRLMDHVRLLNNIDQFVYIQLPVRMGEERKTAELYLFKKKNGKKADPENTNILLALDLENMGHLEALLNIRNKDISIRMEVPGTAEKEYFSEKTVMLHDMLAEAGFKLVNSSISCFKEETTPLNALSALDRYINVRSGRIDYMV